MYPHPLYIKCTCPRICFILSLVVNLALLSAALAFLDMLILSEDIHTPIPNFHP